KFEFEKKSKIPKKFLKILQGATNLMVSNFLKNSFVLHTFRAFKVKTKKKRKKMRRPIKAHLVNRSNRPVNRSNRPVYRSKPVTHAILNLDLNSNRSN